MNYKKNKLLLRIYFIIYFTLLLIFILGIIASMSDITSNKFLGIFQLIVFIIICFFIFKKRNYLKYNATRSFLNIRSNINGFNLKKIIISILSTIIFITIFFFSFYTLRYFFHVYEKSNSEKSLINLQRSIKKNSIELEKKLIEKGSLKNSKLFDSLIQANSNYRYIFYTKNNGIKTIIDSNYMLKSLIAFSGSIYLDNYAFGSDYTKKLGELNEVDLKNIIKGYLNGSIIIKHHKQYTSKNFTRTLSLLSYPSCNYFTYKKNDYIIYDNFSERNKQIGLHSSAFPLSSEDYNKTLTALIDVLD